MRRFFIRQKSHQSRQGSLSSSSNGGPIPNSRSRSSLTGSPLLGHKPQLSPSAVRKRAPALRSRSMSVLYGQEPAEAGSSTKPKRLNFSRSLSFCTEHPLMRNQQQQLHSRKSLTQSEEDEMFKMYTLKLYVMLAVLIAVITGVAVYAFMYNTGKTLRD